MTPNGLTPTPTPGTLQGAQRPRPASGVPHTSAYPVGHSRADSDSLGDAVADAKPHTDADPNTHAQPDPHTFAIPIGDSRADPNAHGDAFADTQPDPDSHADAFADAHPDPRSGSCRAKASNHLLFDCHHAGKCCTECALYRDGLGGPGRVV